MKWVSMAEHLKTSPMAGICWSGVKYVATALWIWKNDNGMGRLGMAPYSQ